MQTTNNLGLKLYEGTDLFNPLVVENPNCETLDEVIKAISDQAVGSATELVTGTVHALTRGLDDADRDVFIFTATSNFTAGDTFTLDGQQVSALTVAGTPLSTGCYIIGSSVLVHKRDTLLTFYVSETTAKDAEKLGGELPSYYATKSGLDALVADVTALATKIGTAVLSTQAQDLSGAVNELNTHLTSLDDKDYDVYAFSGILIHGTGDIISLTGAQPALKFSNYKHLDVCFVDQNQQGQYAMGSATANGDNWIVFCRATADNYFTIRVHAYKN